MKKRPVSHSAYISLRLFLALTLCFAGLSLAVTAYAAWPGLVAAGWLRSQVQNAREAKTNLPPGKSIAMKRSTGTGGTKVASLSAQPSVAIPTVKTATNAAGQTVYSISPSRFDISPPLRELAKIEVPARPRKDRPEPELPEWRKPRSNKPDPVVQVVPGSDQSRGAGAPNVPNAPTAAATGFNFDGISGFSLENGYPPDENGSVGNNQFVEMVNTHYQVWSLDRATKTATSIAGPALISTIFAGFGGECEAQDAGDPIVLYDKLANRWFLSQFTSDTDSNPDPDPTSNGIFYQCVAVSTTPDATGPYARYAFAMPDANGANGSDFGDYPHYGVWPDAYYVMAHNFDNDPDGFAFVAALFGAMDRNKMLAGDPTATWQFILDPLEGGHMPADLDGFAPPPAGAPGIFTSIHPDGMYLYRMKVDFANAANTTRTLQAKMPIAPATAPCGGAGGQCIPQPNSVFTLDSLGDRLMFRLAYRNFIDHESLVVSHSVDPGVPGVVSGVRWYEFRISGQPNSVCGSYPCTYQQGTVADVPNGRSRWMPSIAQDGAGNMIVGYTATGTLEPVDAHSIRYTGRAANDPLGTMSVPETIIQTGNRNVVSDPTAPVRLGRWGDYASTSIDPADDCTFWHVGEFYRQGQGTNTNFDWSTKVASVIFSPTQCQPTTCVTRPVSAPTGVTATSFAPNQIQVTWTAVTPAAGSYAIERAVGTAGSEGPYRPLAYVSGSVTSYLDPTAEGGVTYSYRVIAASDATGRCQAMTRSSAASAAATGICNLKPGFAGVTSATSLDDSSCGVRLNWTPATVNCPLTQTRYNVYRGSTPDFVPSAANRIASCIPGPSSYVDTAALTSGVTYYYVVRAEDTSTGHGGACGGNEETNNVVAAGTAYGPGTQPTPGTWTDRGGDGTSFLRLNARPSDTGAWRIVSTGQDAGANHTPGGDFAYRTAGPDGNTNHGDLECSTAETPVLTVGGDTVNLTYWERHQLETAWDGVAIEYSRNGGPWTDMPAPSNSTGEGCMTSDSTEDYHTLACTDDPPINACGYPTTKPVITGPSLVPGVPDCAVPTGGLTDYARRCHRLTGLTAGDTVQFRWVFTSDPATAFKGFYLDDIAITNIRLPNACNAGPIPTPTPVPTPAAQLLNLSTRMRVDTGDNAGIGGFIITGSATKEVVIRAIGPSLTQFGFSSSEVLQDPTLELHGPGSFATITNNNWRDTQQTQIQNKGLAPSSDLESAIAVTLAPGNYTAIVRGNGGGTGVALVEIYDVDTSTPSKLANLSTRALVGTGGNVVIAGFILGNNPAEDRIVVRGLGPSLTASGISNPLADPKLELRNQNGALLRANNDWQEDVAQAGELAAAGLAPSHPKEAAIAELLPPGLYTAILAGVNDGTGVGLVEVYDRGRD